MGHERLGILPHSKPWISIAKDIYTSLSDQSISLADITKKTLERVRIRYDRLHSDRGVQAAFAYLVALSALDKSSIHGSLTDVDLKIESNPSVLRITADLRDHVYRNIDSHEYAELVIRAAADAITYWSKNQSEQGSLFKAAIPAQEIWSGISGREFCDISRVFFARLTERYLRYFLERELSSQSESIEARQKFASDLTQHLDDISRHAFETAKITQSFAAGWFNKNATEIRPSDTNIVRFLRVASGKLQEELLREQVQS